MDNDHALRVRLDDKQRSLDFYWTAFYTSTLRGHGQVTFHDTERAFQWVLKNPQGEAIQSATYPRTLAGASELINDSFRRFPTLADQVVLEVRESRNGADAWRTVTHELPPHQMGQEIRNHLMRMCEAWDAEQRGLQRSAMSIEDLKRLQLRAAKDAAAATRQEMAEAYRARYEARQRANDEARAKAEAAAAAAAAAIAEAAQAARKKDAATAREQPRANAASTAAGTRSASPSVRRPPPPVAVTLTLPPELLAAWSTGPRGAPLTALDGLRLREQAALWWVSNQSDDLLCLPFCRVRRLDYQVRTALRALGPLQGRALLSDEVGLGKTIEAGLIAKELFTRGMARRLLVLTLPSLVDQWEEELADKFDLVAATTNHPAFAADPAAFWRGQSIIVASLHTFKLPAHLAEASAVAWDLVIVDEAHYLRKRESQAWQAVNALKRQFMLMLTATPVQNSLEELYNLVTLLKPGQLPSPKEFRARFLDPKQPRQPREPEELRRLLGQVMIRNTRANSGLELPPRRAETVLFTPVPAEQARWTEWEQELRAALTRLPANQASLWGRLLLRALGSSPAAWRSALKKFPDAAAAKRWRELGGETSAWGQKVRLLEPLARTDGGVVIFTEFLETQAALAEELRRTGLPVFVINGSTPAAERQPITEQFQRAGGALLLTHSGTEGRNLQFCHCLANFDLPWNPMEIEQRIGRLHRLGQLHPVRICNFVQAGTLQEHLLTVLQEKLNLFELVVGETGLVLGERYSGDEFAEEVFTRWRDNAGRVGEAVAALGDELAAARTAYTEVKALDATLFAKDYESL